MADNSPWEGISNMGAIDQKLYEPTHTISTPQSPTIEKKQTTRGRKSENKAETPAVENIPMVNEQEIRMTLPLPESSASFLDQVERTIFTKRDIKYRSKQRITKNSVIRSWISLLKEVEVDWANIKDDSDLTNRFRKVLKK